MSSLSPTGQQIRDVLATALKRDPSTILLEHHLRDDLGLDSLMIFELLYDLEKAFDLEIPNTDLPGLQTLGNVVNYVDARVNPTLPPSESTQHAPLIKKKLASAPTRGAVSKVTKSKANTTHDGS